MCPLFLKRVAITAALVFVVQSHGAQTGLPANELELNFAPLYLTLTGQEGTIPLTITVTATRGGLPEKDVDILWEISTRKCTWPSSPPTYIDVQPINVCTDKNGEWKCEITNKGDKYESITFFATTTSSNIPSNIANESYLLPPTVPCLTLTAVQNVNVLNIGLTATRGDWPEKGVKIQWQIATQAGHPTHIGVNPTGEHTNEDGKWGCEITNKGDKFEVITFYAGAADSPFCNIVPAAYILPPTAPHVKLTPNWTSQLECVVTAEVTVGSWSMQDVELEWQIFSIPPASPCSANVACNCSTKTGLFGTAKCTLTKQPGPETTVKVRAVVVPPLSPP